MSRIFSVRINLDEINADLLKWRGPDKRMEWLEGFMAGCSGTSLEGVSAAFQSGQGIGLAYHKQAASFQMLQSEHGKKSAAARIAKGGTAIPEGGSNHPPKVVRISTEGPSGIPEPQSEPEPNQSNNRVIEESKERVNEAPVRRQRKRKTIPVSENPPSIEEVQEYKDKVGGILGAADFIDRNTSKGWIQGTAGHPVVDWKAHYRVWNSYEKPKPEDESGCDFNEREYTSDQARQLLIDCGVIKNDR